MQVFLSNSFAFKVDNQKRRVGSIVVLQWGQQYNTIPASLQLMFWVVPLRAQHSFTVREQHMVRRTQYWCTVQWAESRRRGRRRRSDGNRGMPSPNLSGQECPLGAAGDQCSLSLLSNLSLFRLINILVSLGTYNPLPHQWKLINVPAMHVVCLKSMLVLICSIEYHLSQYSGNVKCLLKSQHVQDWWKL